MHFLLEMSGFSRVFSTANELKKKHLTSFVYWENCQISRIPCQHVPTTPPPTTTPILPTYHSPQLLPSTLLSATCWEALLGHPWRYVDIGNFGLKKTDPQVLSIHLLISEVQFSHACKGCIKQETNQWTKEYRSAFQTIFPRDRVIQLKQPLK